MTETRPHFRARHDLLSRNSLLALKAVILGVALQNSASAQECISCEGWGAGGDIQCGCVNSPYGAYPVCCSPWSECGPNNDCVTPDYPPPDSPDAGAPPLPPCDTGSIGDPVNVAGAASVESIEDIRIRGSREDFVFGRYFTSSDAHWDYDGALVGRSMYWNIPAQKVPSPFGSSPTDEYSARWWHNFYSFIRTDLLQVEGYLSVRDTSGYLTRFGPYNCGVPPCTYPLLYSSSMEASTLDNTDAGFVLERPNGERLFFEAPYLDTSVDIVTRYFLSSIQDEAGIVKVSLTYAPSVPDGGSPSDGGCANGVPYITQITTIDGVVLDVTYRPVANVQGTQDCVLGGIYQQGADAGVLVAYTYASDGGAEYGRSLLAKPHTQATLRTMGTSPTNSFEVRAGW